MRVRSSKIEVRCGSACGSIIEVRVCVRHTAKLLATQRLSKIVEIKLLIFTSPAIVGRVKLDHNSKQKNAFQITKLAMVPPQTLRRDLIKKV